MGDKLSSIVYNLHLNSPKAQHDQQRSLCRPRWHKYPNHTPDHLWSWAPRTDPVLCKVRPFVSLNHNENPADEAGVEKLVGPVGPSNYKIVVFRKRSTLDDHLCIEDPGLDLVPSYLTSDKTLTSANRSKESWAFVKCLSTSLDLNPDWLSRTTNESFICFSFLLM